MRNLRGSDCYPVSQQSYRSCFSHSGTGDVDREKN
nr:MAG TPA: hypothetical protein [Caudoviricetes sp.]